MKIIFLGDVFGKPGRTLVLDNIARLKEQYSANIVIINGENLADGRGLTDKTTKSLFDAGVSIITSGNHLWDRYESHEFLKSENRIIKPLNYPKEALGNTHCTINTNNEFLTVFCITGQMFMSACDSPYAAADNFLLSGNFINHTILVDFHAESTAEKRAFAQMFDGRLSAIVGTHTHIQTADEEILPLGTSYITDAGMTGPHDSVIGVKKNLIVEKMRTGMPVRYEVADSGLQINGIFIESDPATNCTLRIERIREKLD
jgi:2',3'-cyclic-nucleotide 2'-phosphodiesterase